MTQSEKEKKEEQIYRQPILPGVLPQYAEQTAEAVEVYKSKGGGVYEQLQERLQAATDNRNRAARRWRDSYEKTGDVMRGFIPKPKDTGDEQRRLKRIALGQAIGQLVGAIGAGVVGATTEGWTPTPTPANLYNGAAARLQQLRQEEDADRQTYANLMARIQREIEQGQYNAAKDELDAAENDVKNLETLLTRMQIAREQIEAERQRNDANNVARAERTESTNESQERRAAMRQQGNGGWGTLSVYGEDPVMTAALLPETKTTTRTNENGEVTTTTSSRTSYSKVEQMEAAHLGKELKQYGVTPSQARRLRGAVERTTATWDTIIYYLQQGYSADYIADLIIGDQSK